MFKKPQNSKSKDGKGKKKRKNAPPAEPLEQQPERDASGEADAPLDESSPADLDPTAEKATQTSPRVDSDDEEEDDDDEGLPHELRMDFVPRFVRATHHRAATYVVMRRRQDSRQGRINFRLRAEIDPAWLRRQHQLREEERVRKQQELESIPPLIIKPHSRIDYLNCHKLRDVVVDKGTSASTPPAAKIKSPARSHSPKKLTINPAPQAQKSVAKGRPSVLLQRKSVAKQKPGSPRKSIQTRIPSIAPRKQTLTGPKKKSIAGTPRQSPVRKGTQVKPAAAQARRSTLKASPSRKGQRSPSRGSPKQTKSPLPSRSGTPRQSPNRKGPSVSPKRDPGRTLSHVKKAVGIKTAPVKAKAAKLIVGKPKK